MYVLGSVIRVHRDRLLLSAEEVPRLAEKVFDAKEREIGYVSNVFGPVSSPFITVKLTGDVELREGAEVFGKRSR